ncbi:MFS transporter [Salinisphaera sp. LB1]|uniref:MFS transporter n=1 Tax=Salinisphaera sp. LB1 TaxID=2183911 RepID=UPI000D7073AE|nr:MFS transporter [Salinisphaera sp. LB1]AWN15805.1 L-Proline/Glycine betaine transporter ProP [Salinisphaera sp. LB1]
MNTSAQVEAAGGQNDDTLSKTQIRRAVGAAAIGNAMEWFDFGVYGYLATTVGQLFFPSKAGHGGHSLLAAFGVFAIAFLARPFGSLFFGPLGDKIGRSRVLIITITMMAAGTTGVGVLPTYQTIGIWAPILLIITRLVQGFSTGGEYGGAATFMVESSPDESRGFFTSFLEFGTLSGYSVGAGLVTIMTVLLPDQAMHNWGWRIPFLCAAPLGLFGLFLRLRLEDSAAFTQLSSKGEQSRAPLRELITEHWQRMLRCVGLVILLNIAYYIVLTYLPSYFEKHLHFSTAESLEMLIAVYIGMMIVIGFVGRISDRIGRKPIIITSGIGFILLSYPVFWLFSTGNMVYTFVGLGVLAFLTVLLSGTMPSTLPSIFPTRIRNGGFAISYNFSTSAFGGTAPYVVTALMGATGNQYMPAFYLMLAGAIGVATVLTIRETAGVPLAGSSALHARPAAAQSG